MRLIRCSAANHVDHRQVKSETITKLVPFIIIMSVLPPSPANWSSSFPATRKEGYECFLTLKPLSLPLSSPVITAFTNIRVAKQSVVLQTLLGRLVLVQLKAQWTKDVFLVEISHLTIPLSSILYYFLGCATTHQQNTGTGWVNERRRNTNEIKFINSLIDCETFSFINCEISFHLIAVLSFVLFAFFVLDSLLSLHLQWEWVNK